MKPGAPKAARVTEAPKEMLARIRAEAEQACLAEVEKVLARHGCKLIGVPGFLADNAGGWKVVTRVAVVHDEK